MVHQFAQMKQGASTSFTPSRLFIYYNERKREGTVDHDWGASIRSGFKSIEREGVCPESMWPYDETPNGRFRKEPSIECYKDALGHQAIGLVS